ncbi:MAG: hypothetical protein HY904_04170 [Deltaproteobacteria bacterium]|nr:hypothetical protein [Deltaproteobacteria bacterium]
MRCFAAFLLLPSIAFAATSKVAVLPLQPGGNKVDAKTAQLLTDRITAEIAKRPDLSVVGTAELQNVVSFEQQKQLLACSDNSCLAELGAALGVDYLVSGTVGDLGSLYVINLSMVDMHQAKLVGRVSDEVTSLDQFIILVPYLAGTLTKGIPGGAPVPARPDLAKTPAAAGAAQPAAGQAGGQAGGSAQANGAAASNKEDGGGSSMPRRIAGLGVAGLGGVVLVLGVLAGAASVGFFVLSRLVLPGSALNTTPARWAGFPIAGAGDLLGIIGVVVLGVGVVLAVLP